MREHEAGRPRVPWRSHPWFKRISDAAGHIAAAALLATGTANSAAARKNTNRPDDRKDAKDAKDESTKDRDRDGGKNRDRDDKRENARNEDRDGKRDASDKSDQDGDRRRDRKREREEDEASGAESRSEKNQVSRQQQADEPEEDEDTDTGGGGGGRGRGGGGDGGGNDAGNAGSGFFDSPLATKARRRANDFDNQDREDEDDGIFVDINPEGESVFETDSISFISGPEGVEVLTRNITFFADPPPEPEPFPELELPVREPGFPFGEDFPFGDATVVVTPTTPEPADPGDAPPPRRADPAPAPAPEDPAPTDTDGGDNTMDFTS